MCTLMGVIHALNLSYPQELKAFFEVPQKIFLQLDALTKSTDDQNKKKTVCMSQLLICILNVMRNRHNFILDQN